MVIVQDIIMGTPAHKAGVKARDKLLAINGHSISDVLDYRFFGAERTLLLDIERDGTPLSLTLHKGEYEDPGMCFATPLMDQKHTCHNKCIFCFIDQLPKGMRKSLYFKDDDTRLSFLHGNYVTLTNLTEADIDRLIEMRISPINVSVHTTNPELRVKMMKNKRAGEVLSYLSKIADAGLSIQGQIVLCRGINDGEELRRTLNDLATYYPALESVSVVPVGLSDHREGLYPLTPFEKEDALEVIQMVDQIGEGFLAKYGTRLVYCSDEFYLKAEKPLPKEAYYEGYPQIENGVGMLRSLIEEVWFALEETSAPQAPITVSIATGIAAYPTISMLADAVMDKYPQVNIHVYAIKNTVFGEKITVSGLLCGKDFCTQLAGKPLGERLLISANTLRAGEDVLLDDMTVGEMSAQLHVPIVPVGDLGQDFVSAILTPAQSE